MNLVILDHPRSQLCISITLSKFGIDPIFRAGNIILLNFAILAEKCLSTPPFWVFLGFEPLNIVGGHRMGFGGLDGVQNPHEGAWLGIFQPKWQNYKIAISPAGISDRYQTLTG